jgi:predicted Zn-dependent protease
MASAASPFPRFQRPRASAQRNAAVFRRALYLVLFLGLSSAFPDAARLAQAHGDIHERIAHLDKLIAATPSDYSLYLKRGDLHRQHREWPEALADFEHARRLDPRPVEVDFYLGNTWLEAGQPDKALPCLERYLDVHPDHSQALLLRGRARAALGEPLAAANDISLAIGRMTQPTPDRYVELARVLIAAGDDHLDAAMAAITQGREKLGPVVSLVEFAVTTETGHGRYDNALAWIDTLPENLATQPRWQARRADVLAAAGRNHTALEGYQGALEAVMQNLQRRNTAANRALEAELRQKIAGLDSRKPEPR